MADPLFQSPTTAGDGELETFVARRHEPPDTLPTPQDVAPEEISLFGKTNFSTGYAAKRYIFGIKRRDRRRHLYVIGKSGVGKTKLMELLMRADIHFGHAVGVVDPHGDLINSMLEFIPENRIDDVVLIDPADRDFPVAFNPIANVADEDKHMVTDSIIEIFKKQFASDWSPRIEHLLRFSCLAMIDYPDGTLNGIVSMLSSGPFRGKVIEHIKDSVVRRFWAIEFPEWSQRYDAEAVSPLLNKFGQLLTDPLLRNIFGQKKSKIDLYEIMQNKKILLVNLSKGRVGDEKSAFFGAVLVTKLYQASMQRIRLPEKDRTPFYLYVDEFQNIATRTFENILAEARKFGFCLTVANQNLSQLSPSLRSSLFGNVASIVSFQISAEDAEIMSNEMQPVFSVNDMINLSEREIYVKMTIDGRRWDPFSADVLTVDKPKHGNFVERIVKQSREKYATPRVQVEKELEGGDSVAKEPEAKPIDMGEIIV
ncbi:type IV secretion system DNA-binding domain-containing protein [Candidatus Uhrbacteria bacterium]|nr:type IV secretion system DNA-binding domain-containing protein [Candidatus Uhrbacteria bacterium]